MPKLYAMPGTCALAPNIAIAWTGAPIDVVTMAYGDHKKDAYRKINDKAKVPALQMDDGRVLTEAAAIMGYIQDEHGGELAPKDAFARARVAEALSYFTSEVHAAYGPHFAKQKFAQSESAQDEAQAATYDTLRSHYERMNAHLSDAGDWWLGEKSVADAFLYVLTRWIEQTPIKLRAYPTLAVFRDQMEDDEGVQAALERQDMKPVG